MRSRLSVPPDGRSGPEPGLIRLIKKNNNKRAQQLREEFFSEASRMTKEGIK